MNFFTYKCRPIMSHKVTNKVKLVLSCYFIFSGAFFTLILFVGILYGGYMAIKLDVSIEDVRNKVFEKMTSKAPQATSFLREVFEITDRQRLVENVDIDKWRGKGASYLRNFSDDVIIDKDSVLTVSSVSELRRALKSVKAGGTIKIQPGTYRIHSRAIQIKHSGQQLKPITVVAEKLGDVTLELDTLEGFYINRPYWKFLNLVIKGVCASDGRCEHAFHVVGGGHNAVIHNNVILNFNAAIKANGILKHGKSDYPDNGKITNNTFYNQTIRKTSKPVTMLDMVGVNDWIVSDNLIADFIKAKGDKTSYGAFFKGNGFRNIFERNLVICRLNLKLDEAVQVGLSFGGGGTTKTSCRNQVCSQEHSGGIARHNIVMNCSDVGIYLNKSANTEIYNNMLINTVGIDTRFKASSAVIANNFISGRIRDRNGGVSEELSNIVTDLEDVSQYYVNPMSGDFTLKNRAGIIGQGVNLQKIEQDFCGNDRKLGQIDIGAFVYNDQNTTCPPFGR